MTTEEPAPIANPRTATDPSYSGLNAPYATTPSKEVTENSNRSRVCDSCQSVTTQIVVLNFIFPALHNP